MNTLIILLGPTAVGKTELSLRLADRFHSPILSCDSRQLYRDLPIGTAAPTADQLARAKHYFIGTLGLEDYYSAAQYEQDALAVLQEEFRQHDTLVMTGGSMMYIDAVCQGIDDIPTVDIETCSNSAMLPRASNPSRRSSACSTPNTMPFATSAIPSASSTPSRFAT